MIYEYVSGIQRYSIIPAIGQFCKAIILLLCILKKDRQIKTKRTDKKVPFHIVFILLSTPPFNEGMGFLIYRLITGFAVVVYDALAAFFQQLQQFGAGKAFILDDTLDDELDLKAVVPV